MRFQMMGTEYVQAYTAVVGLHLNPINAFTDPLHVRSSGIKALWLNVGAAGFPLCGEWFGQ
jgi:hypothetical protein